MRGAGRFDHLYVVVSGAPGSGKSTLAHQISAQLDLPLFSKDVIKEALYDSLGTHSVAESQRLNAAALGVLLALAYENGRGVLESAWKPSVARVKLNALPAPVVEIFCSVDLEIARSRYRERVSARHPGHFDDVHGARTELWSGERAEPVAGDWPVLTVDTETAVDLPSLCARVDAAHG